MPRKSYDFKAFICQEAAWTGHIEETITLRAEIYLMGWVTNNYLAIGFFRAYLLCDIRPGSVGYEKCIVPDSDEPVRGPEVVTNQQELVP